MGIKGKLNLSKSLKIVQIYLVLIMSYVKTQDEEEDYSSIEEINENEELLHPWALIGQEREEKDEEKIEKKNINS
ncbi:Ion_trans_2 domain-containing protein [Meloidogyne graminicola]|uniref:Ion_trans_2 domain-containing protein n=1 Tax=Meloidogyne graminicola TaxID=189291 RepID=A0A8S9ZV50_9BILA|nr:Ion_trans_2 domain-containing protein [Meloidogyne graminicola]